MSEMKTKCDFI